MSRELITYFCVTGERRHSDTLKEIFTVPLDSKPFVAYTEVRLKVNLMVASNNSLLLFNQVSRSEATLSPFAILYNSKITMYIIASRFKVLLHIVLENTITVWNYIDNIFLLLLFLDIPDDFI